MYRRSSTDDLPPEAQVLLRRPLPDARIVAANIIRKYGRVEFQTLIQLFRDNVPTRQIMAGFGVTRQRVAQWREALGTQVVSFEPDPKIVELLPRTEPRVTRRTAV
jgi:hypothetical protein